MKQCNDCPRRCGINRAESLGRCRAPEKFLVARIAPHLWEEPLISGTKGSGTVFFGGCNLGCVYCQNRDIRDGKLGHLYTEEELLEAVTALADTGVHNVNLVTPSHYVRALVPFLTELKKRIAVPIVWNSSGYETAEAIASLQGLVDIFLPDFKYVDADLAKKYSAAPDYPAVAEKAIQAMVSLVGAPQFDEAGLMIKGVVVRHLVLPGQRKHSAALLSRLSEIVSPNEIKLSLMSQYTPDFVDKEAFPELSRRVTSFEYGSVLDHAISLGFDGYFQARSSATAAFTPDFYENMSL